MRVHEIPGRPKDALLNGAVRPWHIVFIVAVALAVSAVAAWEVTRKYESHRGELYITLCSAMAGAIYLAYVFVVPEFRRSLPVLFARPIVRPHPADLAWAFFAMLCWGYGLYRIAFLFPLMQVKPELSQVMGFGDAGVPIGPVYLAIGFAAVVVAPLAEEVMFRGFLMNLWIAKWGLWAGIIASSVVFGLFHLERTVFAGVMGIAFAMVYLKYDSLWPGIALHAAYNLLTFNWLLGQVVTIKSSAAIQDLANWIPEMIVAMLFFPVAYIFWRRFRPAR